MKISVVLQSVVASKNEWSKLLIASRHIRNGFDVTWADRDAGIHNSVFRESTIRMMADNGQYTFLIVDGSLIQLYYGFDRVTKKLKAANLAFYSASSESKPVDDEAQFAEFVVSPIDDTEVYDPPVGWMRIDYDPTAIERGIIHHDCHLHLSAFPDARFIVSAVPSPRQFVELVFASVYPEEYKAHCLKLADSSSSGSRNWTYKDPQRIENLNGDCLPIEDLVYKQLSHFRIPISR